MKRKLLAILVCLAAALSATIALRSRDRSAALPTPASQDAVGTELDATAELVVPPSATLAATSAEAPGTENVEQRASAARSADLARVCVHVVTRDGIPLPHLRVRIGPPEMANSDEDDAHSVHGRTDSAGFALLEVPSGAPLVVFADAAHEGCRDAEADLEPLAAEELREIELQVEPKPYLVFVVRVVAAENGEPVAGARVRLHAGRRSEVVVDELALAPACRRIDARTDASGFVELHTDASEPLVASFVAEGRVRAHTECGAGHETRDDALVVSLTREAVLRVRASDAGTGPLQGIEVRACTEGLYLQEYEPLPDNELFGAVVLPDLRWRAATDAAGIVELRGLPSLAPLRVELVRAGEVIHREPDPLLLEAGEMRELEIVLGSGARIVGRVVEQDGRPVPDLEIWRQKARRDGLWYFGEDDPVTSKATSDTEGRFAFEDVPPGDWWIGPAALPGLESAADENAIAAAPERVNVPSGVPEVAIQLVVHRGLYVRGIALDPAGEPVHRVNIWPSDFELTQSLATFTAEDGRFALGPLVPGDYDLFAQGSIAGFASQGPITARAGENLVIRMERAVELRGRVVGIDGNGCAAEVALEWIGTTRPWQLGTETPVVKKDGRFAVRGVSPGSYVLWGERPGGQVGCVEGLEFAAGATIEGVVLPLEPGATLLVSLAGASASEELFLLRDGKLLKRFFAGTKRPKPMRVPAGTFAIELRDERERVLGSQSVQVAAGETRAVVIHDARAK